MTSYDLSRGYQQKDAFVITGGHCDCEIYRLFLSLFLFLLWLFLPSTVLPPGGEHCQNSRFFFLKPFFCNNFWLKSCTNFLLPASCSCPQDASNELSLDLEKSCRKFDLRSRSWHAPKKVMLHISRSSGAGVIRRIRTVILCHTNISLDDIWE